MSRELVCMLGKACKASKISGRFPSTAYRWRWADTLGDPLQSLGQCDQVHVFDGTGLGLFIAKNAAEIHLKRTPGKGTTIAIQF